MLKFPELSLTKKTNNYKRIGLSKHRPNRISSNNRHSASKSSSPTIPSALPLILFNQQITAG
jgi:hypothetical protein